MLAPALSRLVASTGHSKRGALVPALTSGLSVGIVDPRRRLFAQRAPGPHAFPCWTQAGYLALLNGASGRGKAGVRIVAGVIEGQCRDSAGAARAADRR